MRFRSTAKTQRISDLLMPGFKKMRDTTVCIACKAIARVLIGYRRMGGTREQCAYIANKICVGANIASKRVCAGAIDLNIVSFKNFRFIWVFIKIFSI